MEFRPINWSRDSAAMRNLDASFVTDRVYAVRRADLCFSLVEEICAPPFTKRYELALTEEALAGSVASVAAYEGTVLGGFAIVREELWNRRAMITDFFVDRGFRRRGVGMNMMEHLGRCMAGTAARVLCVETQNVNFPAIAFYRSVGFEVCGFDSTLYDAPRSAEVAIYLSKPITNDGCAGRSHSGDGP